VGSAARDGLAIPVAGSAGNVYDRFAWVYAFCREHLFHDDTELIASVLWGSGGPPGGTRLMELGCGPGVYARRLAGRFAQLRAVGVDSSERQLERARRRATVDGVRNCRFERSDALSLAAPEACFDAVVASRLLMVLAGRERVVAEIFRVLAPGGRFFAAEPRCAGRASVPLRTMTMLSGLGAVRSGRPPSLRPRPASVLTAREFDALVHGLPWSTVRTWTNGWYQYALCEKARTEIAEPGEHDGGIGCGRVNEPCATAEPRWLGAALQPPERP
jgi:SAM-dependent methyltransferase